MNYLQPIEHKGIRVLTTQQLADAYGTDVKTISKNFNNNRDRYTNGKHYYCLEGADLKAFKGNSQILGIATNINKLYLWTEKGCFLAAKSLNTDKAWEVYDHLVDTYFKARDIAINRNALSANMQMLYGMIDSLAAIELAQKKQDERIEAVDSELKGMKQALTERSTDWKGDMNKFIRIIAKSRNVDYKQVYNEFYQELEQTGRADLLARQRNRLKNMANSGHTQAYIKEQSRYITIISDDERLRHIFDTIVRKHLITDCEPSIYATILSNKGE